MNKKLIFFKSLSIILLIILCFNISCKNRKQIRVSKSSNKISTDSFYRIVSSYCDFVKLGDTLLINKINARQYIMVQNTWFQYRNRLYRDKKDSIMFQCLKSGSPIVDNVEERYCKGLLGRQNYIEELNINIPPGGDTTSYYRIIEIEKYYDSLKRRR